jgi:hypothetical protein
VAHEGAAAGERALQASEAPKAPITKAAMPGAEAWATAGRPTISPANVATLR